MITLLLKALFDTCLMVAIASIIATGFGIPLGILLATTQRHGILAKPLLHRLLVILTDATRSIPFIILLVAITPLTRYIVGTSIGTAAAVVPLSIGAIPFVARIIESALYDIPTGLIEAGLAMGATPLQIIQKIMLPEALPSMIDGITVVIVSLIGYSAMAGAIGGGGLGEVAIYYGYQRFNMPIMITTVVILVVLVQIVQWLGSTLAKHLRHY